RRLPHRKCAGNAAGDRLVPARNDHRCVPGVRCSDSVDRELQVINRHRGRRRGFRRMRGPGRFPSGATMRYLAVARFRMLTTIREATWVFVFAMVPGLFAAIFEATPEPLFRAAADELLGEFARIALVAWIFHAVVIVAASETFGSMRLFRVDATALPPDLMDSAPITPTQRFWGETLGVFAATATIHIACLPLLAVIAVLSPLPTVVFVWIEAGIVAWMILGSAGA